MGLLLRGLPNGYKIKAFVIFSASAHFGVHNKITKEEQQRYRNEIVLKGKMTAGIF